MQRTDPFLSLDGVEETENDSSTSLEGKNDQTHTLGKSRQRYHSLQDEG